LDVDLAVADEAFGKAGSEAFAVEVADVPEADGDCLLVGNGEFDGV